MEHGKRHENALNVLRIAGGVGGVILLVLQHGRISGFGSAAIYAASWITFLHICIGEYVLVRYLDARSTVQDALDLLAAVFLVAGILSFTSPALWCAFFGGVFALAVTKYLLVARKTGDADVRRYAREKVVWETPAVVALAVLAVVIDKLPPRGTAAYLLQLIILCGTAGFAVWMIGIRHAYRRVVRRQAAATDSEPTIMADERQAHAD